MHLQFKDRSEAGRLLAGKLAAYAGTANGLVLGLPRGGVVVAFEVARALRLPLDVFVVRKLGLPGQPELAMGAIATGGVRVLNPEVILGCRVSAEVIDEVAEVEERELRRREIAYRGHEGAPEVKGRTVILVDDGIATGSTVRAAIHVLKQQHPARLVVAVPTAPPGVVRALRDEADEVIALLTPVSFSGVGEWYRDFSQTTDEEVAGLLNLAARGPAASGARISPLAGLA